VVGNGEKLGFGELSSIAATMSVPEKPALKDKAAFKYIGKPITRHNLGDIVKK